MHGLNPQQRTAVLHTDGPTLVLAGAGSGKTRVIIEKIAHLIQCNRYPARRIAAITFTNKSAKEMRQRIKKRIGSQAIEDLTVSTFHALGLKFLQIDYEAAGLKRGFSVFDKSDTIYLIKEILSYATPEIIQNAHAKISQAKNSGLTPDDMLRAARTPLEKQNADIFFRYQSRLAAFNAVDFDDLLCLPVKVLAADANILSAWRERIGYLLIDEYQDTNHVQYQLLKYLAGPAAHFTCVGDDDQSIYGWRGANPENIALLCKEYHNLKLIKLEQNYRCPNRILRASNALIAKNSHLHSKSLWSDRDDGARIRIWECRDNHHEAEKVAAEILYLSQTKQACWQDFSILFRSNFQSKPLEKALQLLSIPYHLTGGTAFLDYQEIKDVLAWLRLVTNPHDDLSFLRAVQSPKRDIGVASIAKIAEMASSHGLPLLRAAESISVLKKLSPRVANSLRNFTDLIAALRQQSRHLAPAEMVQRVIDDAGIIEQLRRQAKNNSSFERSKSHLDDLSAWFEASSRSRPVSDLTAQLMLLSRDDKDNTSNQVRLMSLHASKGLEFPFVFIVGCEDGQIPHQVSIDQGQIEEERRLFYVGMTRAKEKLWLSYSQSSQKFNDVLHRQPSRFLDELPHDELERDGADPAADAHQRRVRSQSHIAMIADYLENALSNEESS